MALQPLRLDSANLHPLAAGDHFLDTPGNSKTLQLDVQPEESNMEPVTSDVHDLWTFGKVVATFRC